MRIAVVGSGAMGSLFGGMLSRVAKVCLLDPWTEHVAAIQREGLHVEGASGEWTVKPRATTDPADVGPTDLAIILVKSNRTEWACEKAKGFLNPDGLALTLQNGLGNRDVIARTLGEGRAWQGTTSHGAMLVAPGHIWHAGKGPTHVECRPEIESRIQDITNLFESAGIDIHISSDLDSLLWGKLVINAGINPLTALLRVENGVLSDLDGPRALMEQAVDEAVLVATAKGIVLPYENPQQRVREVAAATGENRSSMLADVLRGSPTEVDFINGAIVREARQLGISAPVNETLVALIKAVEVTYSLRIP